MKLRLPRFMCYTLCGHGLYRVHASCLWCITRKWWYGKVRRSDYRYIREYGIIAPKYGCYATFRFTEKISATEDTVLEVHLFLNGYRRLRTIRDLIFIRIMIPLILKCKYSNIRKYLFTIVEGLTV